MTNPRPGVSEVVVPFLTVNDDRVQVTEILVAEGAQVRAAETLMVVTTSKAAYDVDAPSAGYFWPLVAADDEVAVPAVGALITDTPERPDVPAAPEVAGLADEPRATASAADVARSHGLDLGTLNKRGIIRVRDVEEALAERGDPAEAGTGDASGTRVASIEGVVDPGFLERIGGPGSDFARLSSDDKIARYREAGAQIGEGVTFAEGAVILAESMVVGDGCEFGRDTVIKAQRLTVGSGCIFGERNDIMCRRLSFGDMLFLVNRVLIGQGGAFGEKAELRVGHNCLISSDVLINTAHRVTIGDITCLSPRVCIYTHSHWQNVLEGYSATFAPVEIGSQVWITGNCLVTPGVVMGDGSQALANSTIVGRVADRTVVSGVPAKPLRTIDGNLSLSRKDAIMRRIWPEVERALRVASLPVGSAAYRGTAPDDGEEAPVQVAFGSRPESYAGAFFDLTSYRFSGPGGRVADEVRNVLRKHGIRFSPHDWRYRADAGRYNA